VAALLAVCPPAARAQPGAAGEQVPADVSQQVEAAAASLLADALVREATATLQTPQGRPAEHQVERAAILLALASEQQPEDAELWRLRAELARQQGDAQTLTDSLRAYVRLVPEDDAALLELVIARLNAYPTLDRRLQAVQRLLRSTGAARLSSPLKSRLHTYAANAAQELMDSEAFVEHLNQAVSLDPANADAAWLTYDWIRRRSGSPRQVATSLVSLVKASPTAAEPRLLLAGLLATHGVYGRATQQYQVAQQLGGRLPDEAYSSWALSLAALRQDEPALGLIDQVRQLLADEAGEAGEQVPLLMELVRLAIERDAAAADESQLAGADAAATLQRVQERLGVAGARAMGEMAWITAVLGPDPSAAEQFIVQTPDSQAPLRNLARGWVFLRSGDTASATELLTPLEPQYPLAALGLAMLSGEDAAGRAIRLREVVQQGPESLAGLLAARQLIEDEREVWPTDDGRAMGSLMNRTSPRVWRLSTERTPWVTVRAEPATQTVGYLQPLELVLTVQNLSRLPISLGSDQTLQGQALVSSTLFRDGRSVPPMPPAVVDVSRRLTLEPGEPLEVRARLDRSLLGAMLAQRPGERYTLNATATLDPRVGPRGGIRPGPLGNADTLRGIDVTGMRAEEVLAAIQAGPDADPGRWLRAVAAANRYGGEARPTGPGAADTAAASAVPLPQQTGQQSLTAAAAEALRPRVARMGPAELAWTLYSTQSRDQAGSPMSPVFQVAGRSDEAIVRVAYLLTQVTDPQAPALVDALRSDDEQLRRFAVAWRQALQGG
jgi:hypothetical protein